MDNGQDAADGSTSGKKTYSVHVQAKAQSSTSCSFCWFIMTLYPTLKGMTDRDTVTFKSHLEKSHGLQGDIQR